jgi:hypothetical protein
MGKPVARLKLLTTEGKVVDAILYCHQETTTIAGTTYYLLKLDKPADAAGTTLSVSTATTGLKVWGQFVFPLTGIVKILASTIYATYRAYTGGGTVNAQIDILIRQSNGTVRTTIATGVSPSDNLGTTWATYTGASYSFAEYTVVDQTDYLEIDYIANVTVKKAAQYAYLRIDDNTLALADQTRSQEWAFSLATFKTTDPDAVLDPFQRKCFYAAGRFWAFYSDGTNMVYCTSVDGTTWSSPITVRACTHGYDFSIWFDGTYVHYAYAAGTSIYYRRGIPNSDGTITWSADEQTVSTAYNSARYPFVSVDSYGYAWIGYQDYDGTNTYPYVIKSGNNDGTWGTTPTGFPYQLSTYSTDWHVSVIPLTYGKMLALYAYTNGAVYARRWDGSAWGPEVTTGSLITYGANFSAVAQGDDVHVVFLATPAVYDIIYVKYIYSTNSYGPETTLAAAVSSTSVPIISINPSTNDLYVFWAGYPTANHIYYRKYNASTGTWETAVDWIAETETLTANDTITCFYQAYGGYIGLMYMTGTESPYNVKFAFLTVIVAVAETIVAKNFPMDYLPSPVKAEQLTSKVSGATITIVSQDYPLTLIKKDKAQELMSKFSAT